MRVSPLARKSKALSAALNVTATEPEPEPVPSDAVADSAPARAAATPLGSVAPPDQVAEVTLVLTVWWSVRSTSVKTNVPVVLRPSVTVCGPEASAARTGASLVPMMVIVTGRVKLTP